MNSDTPTTSPPQNPQSTTGHHRQKPKKKRWGWGVAAFIIAAIALSGGQGDQNKNNLTPDSSATPASSVTQTDSNTPETAAPTAEAPAQTTAPTPAPATTPTPEQNTAAAPTSSSSNLSNDNTYVNSAGNTVHSPATTTDGSVPAGASAKCVDGTFSFSQSRRGTCSHHGGVASWL